MMRTIKLAKDAGYKVETMTNNQWYRYLHSKKYSEQSDGVGRPILCKIEKETGILSGKLQTILSR